MSGGGCNVEIFWDLVTVLLKTVDQGIKKSNDCDETVISL
jgi:hypothetical protein